MSKKNNLLKKWKKKVAETGSVLCAGFYPPADFLGRSDIDPRETIENNEPFLNWCIDYIHQTAPYLAAIKPNTLYWSYPGDSKVLHHCLYIAKKVFQLCIIDDSMLPSISSTNQAGIDNAVTHNADAITIAPFAGSMKECIQQGKDRDIASIAMCLMSNPQFHREKNNLVRVNSDHYDPQDITWVKVNKKTRPHVKRYIALAQNAVRHGANGIVIGAPSLANQITEAEIAKVASIVGKDMFVLTLGVGSQGGKVDVLWKYFDADQVMVNVGRGLMFPRGSHSKGKDQAQAALKYRDELNELRIRMSS